MPDNRNCVITVRMNQEDYANLKLFAAEREMSVAAAIRYFTKKGLQLNHEQELVEVSD